jgi:hypothetical protein
MVHHCPKFKQRDGYDMERTEIGDLVQATCAIEETVSDGTRIVYARLGSIGHVIDLRPGFLPTIFFESTNKVCDCEPGAEFKRLGGFNTGRYLAPQTTGGHLQ